MNGTFSTEIPNLLSRNVPLRLEPWILILSLMCILPNPLNYSVLPMYLSSESIYLADLGLDVVLRLLPRPIDHGLPPSFHTKIAQRFIRSR
jgi:hypothetical protein